jgi:hypothetical protein
VTIVRGTIVAASLTKARPTRVTCVRPRVDQGESMSTIRNAGILLRTSACLAITGAFALVSGCLATDPGAVAEGSTAVAEEATVPGPPGPPGPAVEPGLFSCERSTGPATLAVQADGTCFIQWPRNPGSSMSYCSGTACPACWILAKQIIGCQLQ